jgi:fatty-acyl-CoA synthase
MSAFLFTGYVLVLLSITVPPVWMAMMVLPAGRLPDWLLKRWAGVVIRASGCRLRVTGAAHLRRDGPVMLVSNHASYLDSIALMAAIPLAYRFVVDVRHETWPLVGTAIRKARYVTVDRRTPRARAACLHMIAATLERGVSLLMFPEGRRSRGSGLLPFRSGAFRAAIEANRPVIPITVRGTRAIWPPDGCWLRRGPIEVIIHDAIEPMGRERGDIARLRASAQLEIERGLRQRIAIDGRERHSALSASSGSMSVARSDET